MQRTRLGFREPHAQETRREPLLGDGLVLTDADRLRARLDEALSRTTRWQGNAT